MSCLRSKKIVSYHQSYNITGYQDLKTTSVVYTKGVNYHQSCLMNEDLLSYTSLTSLTHLHYFQGLVSINSISFPSNRTYTDRINPLVRVFSLTRWGLQFVGNIIEFLQSSGLLFRIYRFSIPIGDP